jgi:hypothetical protein
MTRFSFMPIRSFILIAFASFSAAAFAAPRSDGELRIEVVDAATGKPIAARMHLSAGIAPIRKQAAGTARRPAKLNMPGSAEFGGHFYIDGTATLPLRVGKYTFELEAGPEYLTQSGHFEIERHADDSQRIEMKRVTDLAKEGWYAGDLDTNRNAKDLPLILRAEGLSIAPNTEPQNKNEVQLQSAIRNPKSEINIAPTPYAWDLPVWLASVKLTAIELIHNHSLRNAVVDSEKDGRPRDKTFFPGPRGNGRWSETVYHHVLNCGLRIAPAAGSGSGANDNPVGTNRVYVFCGGEFNDEAWWEGLKEGRAFVTNGPLLRPMVEGQPPGHVFHIADGGSLTLEIGLNLATAVPVEYLQIVKNGAVEHEVRLPEWKGKKGRLPPLHFDDSGWFLVRAVTSNTKVYQFASSGPYYVEKAGRPRISRTSVRFFIDWIDANMSRIKTAPGGDPAKKESLLAVQKQARDFFEKLLAKANAD